MELAYKVGRLRVTTAVGNVWPRPMHLTGSWVYTIPKSTLYPTLQLFKIVKFNILGKCNEYKNEYIKCKIYKCICRSEEHFTLH